MSQQKKNDEALHSLSQWNRLSDEKLEFPRLSSNEIAENKSWNSFIHFLSLPVACWLSKNVQQLLGLDFYILFRYLNVWDEGRSIKMIEWKNLINKIAEWSSYNIFNRCFVFRQDEYSSILVSERERERVRVKEEKNTLKWLFKMNYECKWLRG